MPLRQLIRDESELVLSPEELKVILKAFEDTLAVLQLKNREDPLTLRIARCILDLAKAGQRDPDKVRQHTLAIIHLEAVGCNEPPGGGCRSTPRTVRGKGPSLVQLGNR